MFSLRSTNETFLFFSKCLIFCGFCIFFHNFLLDFVLFVCFKFYILKSSCRVVVIHWWHIKIIWIDDLQSHSFGYNVGIRLVQLLITYVCGGITCGTYVVCKKIHKYLRCACSLSNLRILCIAL